MSRLYPARLVPAVLGLAILLTMSASASDVVDVRWQGDDATIRFSDSLGYTIDLAESDSSQVLIRLTGARLPSTADQGGISIQGPNNREAILTQSGPNELRLTVRAPSRLGYASIWRPYSNTLVVHTFDWSRLEYAQEQYYKALLALEQGLDAQALEILRVAYATGDPRAASALGVYHARRGENALAMQYLAKPVTPDDHAALAAIQSRGGDSLGAAGNQQAFKDMTAERDTSWARSNATTRRNDTAQNVNTDIWNLAGSSDRRWIFLIGGIALLLLLIVLVIWISRRSSRRQAVEEPIPPMYRRDPPPVREAPERVVEAREVRSTPPPVDPPAVTADERRARTEPEAVVVEPVQPAPPVQPLPPTEPEPAPREVTPVETVAPPPADPHTIAKEEALDVEARPAGDAPAGRRPLPTQAAELRRKIEAMRETPTPPPAPPKKSTPSSESTVAEARRLQLSRDSVELRRRLQQDPGKE